MHFSFRHILGLALVLAILASAGAKAQTLQTLYTFTGGADGGSPVGGVVFGRNGTLYGTTASGGADADEFAAGGGTVFELAPPLIAGDPWTESVLVNFYGPTQGQNCSQPVIAGNGVAGFSPQAVPTFDKAGNLYAAASQSGCDEGTIVELTQNHNRFTIANVLQFQLGYPQRQDTRGNTPLDWGGLIYDTAGNVYGTTVGDGAHQAGEVFELGTGLPNNVVNLRYSFATAGTLGDGPQSGLVFGTAGQLYGTTSGAFSGGPPNQKIFQLNSDGSSASLYTFAPATGFDPGTLIRHGANLYGTARNGGTLPSGGTGQGVVYELQNTSKGWKYLVLHTFGAGSDGAHPFALVFGPGGVLYGNATNGGPDGVSGMIFKLTPAAKDMPWTETVEWNFDATDANGTSPTGNLAIDKYGALYGVTAGGEGGAANEGTVFKLVP